MSAGVHLVMPSNVLNGNAEAIPLVSCAAPILRRSRPSNHLIIGIGWGSVYSQICFMERQQWSTDIPVYPKRSLKLQRSLANKTQLLPVNEDRIEEQRQVPRKVPELLTGQGSMSAGRAPPTHRRAPPAARAPPARGRHRLAKSVANPSTRPLAIASHPQPPPAGEQQQQHHCRPSPVPPLSAPASASPNHARPSSAAPFSSARRSGR